MKLLNRIEEITRLWEMIVPNFSVPPAAWLARLCAYPDSAIEGGIIRASKRFSPDRVDESVQDENVWKYVSATARAIAEKCAANATSIGESN
jgi:hypothetical protein